MRTRPAPTRRARPGALILPLAAALAGAAPPAAQAVQTTQSDLGPNEVMVSACGGLQTGNGWGPGGLVGMVAGRSLCESSRATQPGTWAARAVTYDESPTAVRALSEGQAQFGQLRLASSFEADTANGLTLGVVNAGWNAQQTVVPLDPSKLGQLALYSFDIHVHGVLEGAAQGNSFSGISMVALANGGFYGSSWASQRPSMNGLPFQRTLDEWVTMSVPVTLGTPFTLGFYAATWSGNSSGFGGASQASTDLLNTITWMGSHSVTVNGVPVDFTVQSPLGLDWTQAFASPVPEPAAPLLALAGLVLLLGARRAPYAARPWCRVTT